ncbi:MAG TPA: helix-turn-helix domain-containing protein [Dehalococcoidia bacterium]|nr:helix-turn-helix domain-containing protein [Dehalococcoidia bacterium]
MAKRPSGPPFPDSPGAWIACFRHRARVNGREPSPEQFGRLIGRSGATVRRWEANRQVPDDRDISRIAEVCHLSNHHVAFLIMACSRMRAMPAPERSSFVRYVQEVLGSSQYPAVVIDGLFYVRAWNSYLDALGTGFTRALSRDLHPMALIFRAARAHPEASPASDEEALREGLRIFWMGTAVHSHRPEYARMLAELAQEPRFAEMWMDIALGPMDNDRPIGFNKALVSDGPSFDVYSRSMTFPPTYFINEYHPADAVARERVETLRRQGPPRALFRHELHWVQSHCRCGCE